LIFEYGAKFDTKKMQFMWGRKFGNEKKLIGDKYRSVSFQFIRTFGWKSEKQKTGYQKCLENLLARPKEELGN